MSEPVLRADAVTVRRADRVILDALDLAVPEGDRVLIRGDSGAGKTTLFEILGLLDEPTEGRLFVEGTETSALGANDRARIRRETVGIVFQEFNLIPDLTAWENARLPQEHAGGADDGWLADLFTRLEIASLRDAYPATLSGGEKQRLAVARALANRPRVVLADEPTGQLDPATGEAVIDLLMDLQEEVGAAIVVVSHEPGLGERFDRTLQLQDGTLQTD